jgi:hypothetical protein
MNKLIAIFTVLIFTSLFYSCAGSSTSGSCSKDKECGQGSICLSGKCGVQQCTSTSNCPDNVNQVCDENKCTAKECGAGIGECANGKCENFICKVQADGVLEDLPPFDGEILEETSAEVAPDTAADSVVSNGKLCSKCQSEANCGENYKCTLLTAGKYCLKLCSGDGDCPSGYVCYPIPSDGGPKQCTPIPYKCVDCAAQACDSGKVCNLQTGSCEVPKKECEVCDYDFNCDTGYRCYKKEATGKGVCVKECKDGTCPSADFSCSDNGKGVKLCAPQGNACSACPKEKPYLNPKGECVQCLNSTHCTQGQTCNLTTYQCSSCASPKPWLCSDNQCHECCDNSHCNGKQCTNYECPKDQCGNCTSPYPCCVQIQPNYWGCAQCGPGCETECTGTGVPNCGCSASFTCEDTTSPGKPCGTTSTCTPAVKCALDTDCESMTTTGLMCNTAKQSCYDPSGSCDAATGLCCFNPASECKSLLGGLGGMGGMGGLGGMCTCNSNNDCPSGISCMDLSFICTVFPIPGICDSGLSKICFSLGGLPI